MLGTTSTVSGVGHFLQDPLVPEAVIFLVQLELNLVEMTFNGCFIVQLVVRDYQLANLFA